MNNNCFAGLGQVNIELTSRCNKKCWMCGRREREKLYGDQNYGDIDFDLLGLIAEELPPSIMVALHNNGEPMMYPRLGEAIQLFENQTTYFVTNGLLLAEKANEIIDNLDIISVSVIENETPDVADKQFEAINTFLILKGDKRPYFNLRFVGKADVERYKDFNVTKVYRTVHQPKGSIGYRKAPTIPEHGVCQDLLNRLAIDRFGNVSVCVRFDPDGELVLGNIVDTSLDILWSEGKRQDILRKHIEGKRKELVFCGSKCEFYGVPTSE